MASKVSICNLALTRLGASRIVSLSDNTTEAKDLNAIFDQVVENVIALGPWTSATRRITLARLSIAPAYGFNYQYQLPTNPKFIKLIRINECKLGSIPYALEGNVLLCDESSVQIKYLVMLDDTEMYDSYLRQAITERLIVELSYGKTGQTQVAQALEQLYMQKVEGWLNENNMQNNTDRDLPSDTFIDIRHDN